MAEECLSRRHAAADDPLRRHGFPAWRRAGGDRDVHRRQDRHQHRRRTDGRDPGLCDLPDHGERGDRSGLHDPREQLHAVDRDRRRLHDRADDLQPRRLHAGDGQDHPVVAHDRLDVRGLGHRRAGRVPVEAPLHQRRTAAVSGGACQRGRAGCALHRRRACRHVQGAAARCNRRAHRHLPVDHQRWLDEALAVQDPAPGPVGRPERAVGLPRAARHLLLRVATKAARLDSDDPRHRYPPAGSAADARCRDAGRRRPDGDRGGDELPARRLHQFRDPRADHDPGRRHRRAGRADRRDSADLACRDRQPVVAVVGRDDDGGRFAGQPAGTAGDLQGDLQAKREDRRARMW